MKRHRETGEALATVQAGKAAARRLPMRVEPVRKRKAAAPRRGQSASTVRPAPQK